MTTPKWLSPSVVLAVHDMQVAEHGGAEGLRDHDRLHASLARPARAYSYGEMDLSALAAKYAHGIVSAHPFVDGNKRTAFLAAYIFLKINGLRIIAPKLDATRAIWSLAPGDSSEEEFASRIRPGTSPVAVSGSEP